MIPLKATTLSLRQKTDLIGNTIVRDSIIINVIFGNEKYPKFTDAFIDEETTAETYNETTVTWDYYEEPSRSPGSIDYDYGRVEISRGPLRIENPEEIPLLRNFYNSTELNTID